MRVNLSVIADYASVTQEGKLVIAGIFDVLNAQQMPWVQPSMTLVFTINLSAEEEGQHQVSVRAIDPDGQEFLPLLQAPMEATNVDFLDGASLNFILTLNETRLIKYGRHRFDIFVDDQFVQAIPFTVRQTSSANQNN